MTTHLNGRLSLIEDCQGKLQPSFQSVAEMRSTTNWSLIFYTATNRGGVRVN